MDTAIMVITTVVSATTDSIVRSALDLGWAIWDTRILATDWDTDWDTTVDSAWATTEGMVVTAGIVGMEGMVVTAGMVDMAGMDPDRDTTADTVWETMVTVRAMGSVATVMVMVRTTLGMATA